MQHLQPNTTLQGGKYRIEKHLASGGFGNTYAAVNTEFDEKVAIKEFFMKDSMERDESTSAVSVSRPDCFATFAEQKKKFKKEARLLRKFHNDHIIRVHDLFEENGTAYYVMDFIDGEDLSKRMKRTGKPLTEKEVMDLLPQILDALKSVHDAGLWHLDMKPSNIMVDSRGQVKLIDFGASKQLNAQTGGAASTSNIARTDHYAPIEQLDGNYSKLGPWSDIYSLGATLFSLLTKQTPPTPSQIIDDETADRSVALPVPHGISKKMRNLILWMMNTNRTKRPQSIREVEEYIKHNSVGSSDRNDSADRRNGKVSNHSSEETIIDTRQEEKPKAKHDNVNLQDEYNKFYGVSGTEENNVKAEPKREGTDEGETGHTVVVVLFAIAIIIVGLLCIAKCSNDNNSSYKTTTGQLHSSNKYTGFASKDIYTSVGKGRYEGNLKNGIENGRGMITYTNGQKFIGYFKNGVPHGHGTFYDANGKVLYDGEYKNGIRVSVTDYRKAATSSDSTIIITPRFAKKSVKYLSIKKIVLTSKETRVYFEIEDDTGQSYFLSQNTFLTNGTNKYKLQHAINIALEPSETILSKGQILKFSLVFPPLSNNIEKIDFVEEGDPTYNPWIIRGIDLKGN